MQHLTYVAILAGCIVLTLPLEFLIGARVWRRPLLAAASIAGPAAVFIVWDLFGIARGWWTYGARYVMGIDVGPMPLEEILFFLVVPICGLLTYEAVGICGRLLRDRLPGGRPPRKAQRDA